MKDFHKALEQYAKPIETKDTLRDGTRLVVWKVNKQGKSKVFNLKEPNRYGLHSASRINPHEIPLNCSKVPYGKSGSSMKIKTPEGIFNTVKATAQFYNMNPAIVSFHCKNYTSRYFYYYLEGLENKNDKEENN